MIIPVSNNSCLEIFNANTDTLDRYRNFQSFTRTADYPHQPIIAYGEKKSQQITHTGGEPARYVIQLFGGENVTLR